MMELLFLGTGAADFSPLLNTEEGKMSADPSVRRSTATLMDRTVLFDCGPHTPLSFSRFGADMSKVDHVIFTHLHSDHYNPDSLATIASSASRPLHVWYREGGTLVQIENVIYHPMTIGQTYDIGVYRVTAHEANHSAYPLHYSVEGNGTRLFYGLDGAWLLHDTYYAMRDKHYDVMVMDCTVGDYTGDFRLGEHNSVPMLRLMRDSFRTWGSMDDKTLFVCDHIARTLTPSYEEFSEILKKDGMICAYDGMQLAIDGRGHS